MNLGSKTFFYLCPVAELVNAADVCCYKSVHIITMLEAPVHARQCQRKLGVGIKSYQGKLIMGVGRSPTVKRL